MLSDPHDSGQSDDSSLKADCPQTRGHLPQGYVTEVPNRHILRARPPMSPQIVPAKVAIGGGAVPARGRRQRRP